MTISDVKRKEIEYYIKSKGHTKSEVARRLGKEPTSFINNLKKLKTITRLEELEKRIKEVI